MSEAASETPTIHETDEIYYCSAGEDFVAREKEEIEKIKAEAVLPEWRVNPLQGLSVRERISESEEAEVLEEAVFLKRHSKLELDERRRKRWDMQRIREQVNLQRLKARYEQPEHLTKYSSVTNGSSKKNSTKSKKKGKGKNSKKGAEDKGTKEEDEDQMSESLYPDPVNITHIEVSDKLPLCAFGLPIPIVPAEEFSIPWLSDQGEDLEAMELESGHAVTEIGTKTIVSLKIRSPEQGYPDPQPPQVRKLKRVEEESE